MLHRLTPLLPTAGKKSKFGHGRWGFMNGGDEGDEDDEGDEGAEDDESDESSAEEQEASQGDAEQSVYLDVDPGGRWWRECMHCHCKFLIRVSANGYVGHICFTEALFSKIRDGKAGRASLTIANITPGKRHAKCKEKHDTCMRALRKPPPSGNCDCPYHSQNDRSMGEWAAHVRN